MTQAFFPTEYAPDHGSGARATPMRGYGRFGVRAAMIGQLMYAVSFASR
jgi:hypothetical protein